MNSPWQFLILDNEKFKTPETSQVGLIFVKLICAISNVLLPAWGPDCHGKKNRVMMMMMMMMMMMVMMAVIM